MAAVRGVGVLAFEWESTCSAFSTIRLKRLDADADAVQRPLDGCATTGSI